MAEAQPLLDAPIPGQSLTAELGGRPWQSPAQYPTVDEAIEYYMSRMATDEFADSLLEVMEMGIPLTTMANTIQMSNVMEGKHSVDVGMLVMPMLIEMMMLIGDSADVEYDSGLTELKDDTTKDAVLENVRRKLKEKLGEDEETPEVEDVEEEVEEPTGLMARRK
jgi:hypothetical protein|tara:strand:+ start:648 stop:1142 length:495 start_codon:yes stop_codon:yes gene_type:complete